MGKRVVSGGLLAFLAACGGSVDTARTDEPLPTRVPADEQRISGSR